MEVRMLNPKENGTSGDKQKKLPGDREFRAKKSGHVKATRRFYIQSRMIHCAD